MVYSFENRCNFRTYAATQYIEKLDGSLLGQAEADKLKFNPASLDLEQFCQQLIEEISSSSQHQRAVSVSVATPHSEAEATLGASELAIHRELIAFTSQGNCPNAYLDEKLLRQILTNLLSNAIKYSPDGGTVRFDLECMEGVAVLSIQDEGIGVPAEDLPQLFESFHRATNVGTISGTGLGLAIVKKCVDLHGGQITVDSVVDVGTSFSVTLPLNSPVCPSDSPNPESPITNAEETDSEALAM